MEYQYFNVKTYDYLINTLGAGRGAGAQVYDCKRDRLWVWFPLEEMKYLIFPFSSDVKQSEALISVTQHEMPAVFGEKWETKCLYTRFPLPTLLCAGYSVTYKKYIL